MVWDIKRESVYRLYRDGQLIRDTDGQPKNYTSEEEAQHVAANWESYRCPTFAELRGMSDEELEHRAAGEVFPIGSAAAGDSHKSWWRRLF